MRTIPIFSLAVAVAVYSALAESSNLGRRKASPIIFELERLRDHRSGILNPRATAADVPETIDNGDYFYYANLTIGTPPQPLRLRVGCLAADTWVNTPSSAFCQETDNPCAPGGTYNANASSTYRYIQSGFANYYADGTNTSGDWAQDTFSLGGADLTNFQFAIGYNSTFSPSVLGLGYIALEQNTVPQYPNLPVIMKQQGLIDLIAYSLWLDRVNNYTGRLIFGGVDSNKFLGSLATLPILPNDLTYNTTAINMAKTEMTFNGNTTTVSTATLPVALDSGTYLTILPSYITGPIFSALGVTWNSTINLAFCDYSLASNTTTIDVTFDTVKISVPMSELVGTWNSTHAVFGIRPSKWQEGNTLGVTFLRSAYVVFDYSHNQVSIAPTNFMSTKDNVTIIPPNGVEALNLMGTGATTTSSAPPVSSSTHSATSSTSSSTTTSTAAPTGGLSTGAKAGIGVGAALGSLALLLAIAACILLSRRKKQQHQVAASTPAQPIMAEQHHQHSYPQYYQQPQQYHQQPYGPDQIIPKSPSTVDRSSTTVTENQNPYQHQEQYPEVSYRMTGPPGDEPYVHGRHELPTD